MIQISGRTALVAATVALGTYWLFGSSEDQSSTQATVYQAVQAQQAGQQQAGQAASGGEVLTVESHRAGATVTLGGTVIPYKEVTLTAQIPGRVEQLAGQEGDWFEEGTTLVSINDDELLAQRQAAIADIANMEAVMRNAQVQYSRELWSPQGESIYNGSGMGMPSMFDQMFTRPMAGMMGGNNSFGNPYVDRSATLYNQSSQIAQAQSQFMRARSNLEAIDAKLRDAQSIAPFDGVIVKKVVEQGDTVQPGQPLLVFSDTRKLQIQSDIPARLMPGLSLDMRVPARLDVGDTRVDARVAQIFPMADPQRHTVTVKFDLPEGVPGGPGMYAEVMIPDINAPVRDLIAVPESALIWRGSLPAVYVVGDNNQKQLRMVRVGERIGDQVAVLSGLRPGDRILANASAVNSGGEWSSSP